MTHVNENKSLGLYNDKLSNLYYKSGKTVEIVAHELRTTKGTVYNFLSNELVISEPMAERFAKCLKCKIEDFTFRYEVVRRNDYIVGEELNSTYEDTRKGIRNNIQKRLSVCHSIEFVNEVLQSIDDLVLESQYYGVEKCKLNETGEILEKIKKKRTGK